jgi:hypothetical protein
VGWLCTLAAKNVTVHREIVDEFARGDFVGMACNEGIGGQ